MEQKKQELTGEGMIDISLVESRNFDDTEFDEGVIKYDSRFIKKNEHCI